MRATLGYAPVLQTQNLRRFSRGQEVVRDNDGRASLHQATQGLDDPLARFGIEAGVPLVQDENRGVPDHGPRDGYALALSPGKEPPLLSNKRIVARGQGHYEVVGVGHRCGPYYLLLGGAGFTVGYVLAHGAVEYQGFLQQQSDVLPERAQGQVPDVVAVEAYLPGIRVVETQEQLGCRGLPGAARSDEREHLAGSHLEGDVVQRRFFRARIAKANRVELHYAAHSVQRTGPGFVLHRGLLVEELDDPFGPSRG